MERRRERSAERNLSVVRPEAESDVERVYAWYEERRLGLGCEFVEELELPSIRHR